MLEAKDLQKIGKEVGKVIEQNVTPALDQIHDKLDKMDGRMDKMDGHIGRIESQMVTKEYLDDKLADLEGTTIVRQRKEDKKVNLLIEILKERKVIKTADTKRLKEIKVFPDLEKSS